MLDPTLAPERLAIKPAFLDRRQVVRHQIGSDVVALVTRAPHGGGVGLDGHAGAIAGQLPLAGVADSQLSKLELAGRSMCQTSAMGKSATTRGCLMGTLRIRLAHLDAQSIRSEPG